MMSGPRSSAKKGFFKRIEWYVVGAGAGLAFLLGISGFREYYAASDLPYGWLDFIYYSIQLMALNSGDVPPPLPMKLELARILAPTVFFYTILRGVLLLFSERLSRLRLRWARHHVIICGAGRKGLALAQDFLNQGSRVALIGHESDSEGLAFMKQQGAFTLTGNAAEPSVLAQAGFYSCRYLVAACGLDGTNAAIALAASKLAEAKKPAHRITGIIHLANPRLHPMLRGYERMDETASLALRPFNVNQISTRSMLANRPLDRQGIRPNDPGQPHLVIFGLGAFGESLLLQALRIGHYANGRRLKVTVCDRLAQLRQKELLLRFPALHDLAELHFVEADGEDSDTLTRIPGWNEDNGDRLTVAVCFNDDRKNLNVALTLAALLRETQTPILCRMTEDTGLAGMLRDLDDSKDLGCDIHPFGEIERAATVHHLVGQQLDTVAQAVHEYYLQKRQAEGQAMGSAPVMREWKDLSEEFRTSNREQADHVPVKARALSMTIQPLGSACIENLTDEQVEILAKMEHARWAATRILQGWTYGPERSDTRRKSPYLVPWNDIDETVRELDREAVREIPQLLKRMGKGWVPCS